MGRNGHVPSLCVLDIFPKLSCTSSMNAKQTERFQALKLTRTEMKTIVAEERIRRALKSELPPSAIYLIPPGDSGDLVRLYRELTSKRKGTFTDTKLSKKIFQ